MSSSIPVLGKLRANKTALQTILYVLAEWNEVEIQQITKKRVLLASVTALWTRLANADSQLAILWRKLIRNFTDELTAGWDQAVSLRAEYEHALRITLTHLNDDVIPTESHIPLAAQESAEVERVAKAALRKPSIRQDGKFGFGSDKSGKEGYAVEIGKAELSCRYKHSRLNALRRKFVQEAESSYTTLIEEQHGIVSMVTNTLTSYLTTKSKSACHVARATSQLSKMTSSFSPSILEARCHNQLRTDLRLPKYCPQPYVSPKDGIIRRCALVGVEISDEERADNILLAILLDVSIKDTGCLKTRSKRPCLNDAYTDLTYLETHWSPDPRHNGDLLRRRSASMRHSLIILYLSLLPSPLLPMSNQQFTQFALRQVKLKTILSSFHDTNLKLLRDLCEYLGRQCPLSEKMLKEFGNLILRAGSDLMSDGSREKSIVGLMTVLMRHFRREKERTVLDITRSPTPDWSI